MKDELWNKIEEAILEGTDLITNLNGTRNKRKRENMRVVLRNMHTEGRRESDENGKFLLKVLLPVMRRAFSVTVAHDIVGVQTVSGDERTIKVRSEDVLVDLIDQKLSARWTFEVAKDAKAQIGIDIQ